MTRLQAERIVAGTVNVETLTELVGHKNKHVKAKASYKLAKLEANVFTVTSEVES